MKYTTKILHCDYPAKDPHGALRYPIYQNAAFEYDSAEEIEDVFCGRAAGHTYSRATNPTVNELENRVKNITSSLGVIATSSGMAAIANVMFGLLKSGDNIITTNRLFGHTLSFFQNTLVDFGVEVRYVDICDYKSIEKIADDRSKLIFFETISNPELVIPDIKKLKEIASEKNLLLVCDSTMTPFTIFDAKKHGIDIDIISATKMISGGGVAIGGLIIDTKNYNWAKYENLKPFYKKFGPFAFLSKLKKETFRNIGACLSPQNAYLLSLGLETLALRSHRAGENAKRIAEFLKSSSKIESINYPIFEDNQFCKTSNDYFLFPGTILTFDLKDKKSSYRFMNELKLICRSTNIHDNKSLIIAPYHTIYAEYSEEQKREYGLREGSLRLSVGIEDVEDLIEDISLALQSV